MRSSPVSSTVDRVRSIFTELADRPMPLGVPIDELGLDSLVLIQSLVRVEEDFGVALPGIDELLGAESRALEDLADLVDRGGRPMRPHTPGEADAMARSSRAQRDFESHRVAAHYEHDPAVFEFVLDRCMAYSTAMFDHPDEDLDTAQQRKFARFADLLDIQPQERVLDLGCGWGSVLVELAQRSQGCFRGVTLSERQAEVARRRAAAAGVADRVHVDVMHAETLDWAPQSLDVVLFVGSVVHIHDRRRIYQLAGRALRPGGRLLVSDCFFPGTARGDRTSSATTFILSSTLGYCRLLTLSDELAHMEAAGFHVTSVRDLTRDYVLTVARWIDNIRRNRDRIDAIDPGFARELQTYMTIGQLSFVRRTALEYLVVAAK